MTKIIGNPVGVPNPKTNWDQTDEKKADVVLNKPTKLSQFENDTKFVTDEHIHKPSDIVFSFTEDGMVGETLNEMISYLETSIVGAAENKADKVHLHTTRDIFTVFDDGTVDIPLSDCLKAYDEMHVNLSKKAHSLETNKADKTDIDTLQEQTEVAGRLINDLYICKADKEHIHTMQDIATSIFDDGTIDGTLDDYLRSYNDTFENAFGRINELETGKADKEHIHKASDISTKGVMHYDTLDYSLIYLADETDALKTKINVFEDWILYDVPTKTKIQTSEDTSYTFDFSDNYNKEIRLTAPSAISIKFVDDEYASDYISGLSFNCGDTPTGFDYTASGIINWVGTDCTKDGDLSIFQPSANTHYDIVFYFNGSQFIGLVNGFVPATGNVVSV